MNLTHVAYLFQLIDLQAAQAAEVSASSIYDFSAPMYGKEKSLGDYRGKVWMPA